VSNSQNSGGYQRVALIGGLYSNYLALEAALADIRSQGVEAIFCLGDLGAFGPHPDRVFPLLHEAGVQCVRGNYDDSIGNALADCQCGYTDPRDNYFAQISYDYTLANTSDSNRAWLRTLPDEIRITVGGRRVLLCHGSPRKMNEFLWESACSAHFLRHLVDASAAEIVCCTHTGMKWQRDLGEGRKLVNVGVLGRPENDGATHVWYALLTADAATSAVRVDFRPVVYDHQRLAAEMAAERLPAEFIQTVLTGWWTTCLEVLPAKERLRGRF
jgi:predicted phosphodiesterase